MELLLNILWLGLILPAIWIWRRVPGSALQRLGRSCPVLILGCVLVLLFPVVSASDDLRAMRPEMEESSAFSSVQKQSGGAKAIASNHFGNHFAVESTGFASHRNDEVCGVVFPVSAPLPRVIEVRQQIARAPPNAVRSQNLKLLVVQCGFSGGAYAYARGLPLSSDFGRALGALGISLEWSVIGSKRFQ